MIFLHKLAGTVSLLPRQAFLASSATPTTVSRLGFRAFATEQPKDKNKDAPDQPLRGPAGTYPEKKDPSTREETILDNLPREFTVNKKLPKDAPPVFTNPSGTSGQHNLWMYAVGAALGFGVYYYYKPAPPGEVKVTQGAAPPAAMPGPKAEPAIDRIEKTK